MQFMCHDKGRLQEMVAGMSARAAPCTLPELTLKRSVLDGLQGLYRKCVVLYPFMGRKMAMSFLFLGDLGSIEKKCGFVPPLGRRMAMSSLFLGGRGSI